MEPEERAAWLTLASVEGVGVRTFWRALATHGSAGAVLAAAQAGRALTGPGERDLPREVRRSIAEAARDRERGGREAAAASVWVLTVLDTGYPARFEVLDDRPPCLYGLGDASLLTAPYAVAVVGTRRPTPAGRLLATRVASRLVELGVVVVSGLAIGIDGAAHAAAVASHGRTLAIIGAGHAEPGPRAHRSLVTAILARGGAVISELAPHAAATRGTFPRRNRLLAAASDAVVVIEAPSRSGALNTAHHALEQGRPLFVAPGRPGDPSVAGCLRLLRETEARPLVGIDELVEDLAALRPRPAASETASAAPDDQGRPGSGDPLPLGRAAALATLGGGERAVAEALGHLPAGLDRLVQRTRLAPAAVAGAITLLQLRGWIQVVDDTVLPAGPLLLER